MKKARLIFALAVMAILVGACDLLNCTPADVRCLTIEIYDTNGNKIELPDTLTVVAAGTDSILVNKSTKTKEILLPLSYHAPEDTFVLQSFGNGYYQEDSLFVSKTNDIYFESPDCPTVMMHNIKSIRCTHEYVDSVSLINSKVNFTETTHARLIIQID